MQIVTLATKLPIGAIVLAAGTATRFGSTKQLVEIDGVPLVRNAAHIASDACGANVVIVIGHDAPAVMHACLPAVGFFIVNDEHTDGIGTSIARAVRAVRHSASAFIVTLADQPLITGDHLRSLSTTWSGDDREIVATKFADTIGPPVLFGSACFDDLAALNGDRGARSLLEGGRYSVRTVVFEPAAVDIDEPADLEGLVADGMFLDRSKAQRSEP